MRSGKTAPSTWDNDVSMHFRYQGGHSPPFIELLLSIQRHDSFQVQWNSYVAVNYDLSS